MSSEPAFDCSSTPVVPPKVAIPRNPPTRYTLPDGAVTTS